MGLSDCTPRKAIRCWGRTWPSPRTKTNRAQSVRRQVRWWLPLLDTCCQLFILSHDVVQLRVPTRQSLLPFLHGQPTRYSLPSLAQFLPSLLPVAGQHWTRRLGVRTRYESDKKRKLRLPRRCAVKECADCWMHMVQTIDFPVQCITCSCLTCQTPLPGPENLAMSWVSLFNIS